MYRLIVILLVAGSFFTENLAFKIPQKGVTDQIGQVPYYAHLEVEVNYYGLLGKRSCGAVIIDNLWLATSAYCLNKAERLTVQLSSPPATNDTSEPSQTYIKVERTNFFKHPSYNKMMSWNDIGEFLNFLNQF